MKMEIFDCEDNENEQSNDKNNSSNVNDSFIIKLHLQVTIKSNYIIHISLLISFVWMQSIFPIEIFLF